MHLVESFPTVGELEVLVIDLQPERLGFLVGGGLIDGQTVCPLLVVSRDNAWPSTCKRYSPGTKPLTIMRSRADWRDGWMFPEKGEVDWRRFFVDLKANLFSFGPNLPDTYPTGFRLAGFGIEVDPPGRSGGVRESASVLEVAQYPYSFKRIPFSVILGVFVFHQIDRGVVKIYEGNAFFQANGLH